MSEETKPAPRPAPRGAPDVLGALGPARRALRKGLRGPLVASLGVALAFFGGFALWSVLAPLASAAVAPGTISPEGHRKTVQHLEGGIIREIAVKDGDRVAAGQILMVLEDTQALARFRLQQARNLTLRALEARLQAEESWREILERRIAQLEEEIQGLEAQILSGTRQLELIAKEVVSVEALLKKGLARLPRLLALQRSQADIEGRRAANRAAIARSRQAIGEAELQIMALEVNRRDEAAKELGDVRAELGQVEERMGGARDVLSRTVITAPVPGTVFDLRHKTTGVVVQPGEPIMDIVPGGDDLLVDARVSPADIDVVAVGFDAEVTLTAFPQRNLPRLTGQVRHLSADSITDAKSGEVYYLARIEIEGDALAELGGDVELLPGMPADVMIFTGTLSLFEYLTDPLMASLHRSLREH